MGNTVIVVEHDEDTIRAATLSSISGRAGRSRGNVVYAGGVTGLLDCKSSVTGKIFLTERNPRPGNAPRVKRPYPARPRARHNNLKDIDVDFRWGPSSPSRAFPVREKARSSTRFSTSGCGELNGARIKPGKHDDILASRRSTRSLPSTSHPSAARRAQIPRHTPACSPISAICSPDKRGENPRLFGRRFPSTSRAGAASLSGRRHHQNRNALSARRLRPVRGLQG